MAFARNGMRLLALIVLWATTRSLGAKWIALGCILYALPVILTYSKNTMVRSVSWCFLVFMIAQSLLSQYIMDRQLKTMRPGLHRRFDVREGIPGIRGMQDITTDARGFRVTRAIDYSKKRECRIVAIGGSSTEQLLLDDRSTWTHLLQENLRSRFRIDAEVINAGVSGTRIQHNYITLLNTLGMKPDIIVFHAGINDAYYHIMSNFDPFMDFALDRSFVGRTIRRLMGGAVAAMTSRADGVVVTEVINAKDASQERNSLARQIKKTFRPISVSENYADYLAKVVRTCKERGVACVFVTQPGGYQEPASEEYKKGLWMTPPQKSYTLDFSSMVYISDLYRAYTAAVATNAGFSVVELKGRILPSYDYLYDDCHFNARGARAVADLVTDAVVPIIVQRGRNGK